MQLTINDKQYDVPFDPMLITVDKFIEWWEMYGKDINERYVALIPAKDKKERNVEVEIDQFELDKIIDDEAIAWFSFWTGLDLSQAKELPEIQPLLINYRLYKQILIDEEEKAKEESAWSFNWNGEDWRIQDYKINPANKMSFREVATGKDIIHQIKNLEESKWTALKYLSSVFVRKVGEPFSNEMIWENSDRLRLMGTLPIVHAFKVGFFLSICVSILKTLSQSFPEAEAEWMSGILQDSTTNGDGLNSLTLLQNQEYSQSKAVN